MQLNYFHHYISSYIDPIFIGPRIYKIKIIFYYACNLLKGCVLEFTSEESSAKKVKSEHFGKSLIKKLITIEVQVLNPGAHRDQSSKV